MAKVSVSEIMQLADSFEHLKAYVENASIPSEKWEDENIPDKQRVFLALRRFGALIDMMTDATITLKGG